MYDAFSFKIAKFWESNVQYSDHYELYCITYLVDFPGGSGGKESTCNVGSPGFHPWVGKIPTQKGMQKGMAIHSNILAWEIPWTEEPGGLQSIGLHDWAINTALHCII